MGGWSGAQSQAPTADTRSPPDDCGRQSRESAAPIFRALNEAVATSVIGDAQQRTDVPHRVGVAASRWATRTRPRHHQGRVRACSQDLPPE